MVKWTEVTKSNFSAKLPEVLEAINEADFITFDTELTGLQTQRSNRYSTLDDLTTRYAKTRDSAANFGLLQVGLSCFRWSQKKSKYATTAFSFYLFPAAVNGIQQDRKFTCQLGSISFLAEFGFDFNKSFKEGIPFITQKEENILKSNSAFYDKDNDSKNNNSSSSDKPLIVLKAEDRALVEEICEKVAEWLKAKNESGELEPFDLPQMNSFQRLIFYQQLPLKFGDQLAITKKGNTLRLTLPLNEDARKAAFEEEKLQFERSLNEQVGFRKIMDHIVSSGKPIIGHNCWLDLLHFYNKFVDSSFPSILSEYKSALTAKFSRVLDTKYLASLCSDLMGTSLSDLTELFTANYPEVMYFKDQEKSSNKKNKKSGDSEDTKYHDAGFDSICTGRVFLSLLQYKLKKEIITKAAEPGKVISLQDLVNQAIQEDSDYVNRLFVMNSEYAFINLTGTDVEPARSSVLYLYGFPPSTNTGALQEAMVKAAGPSITLTTPQIHWLTDTACFVQFEQEEGAFAVLEAVKSNEISGWPDARIITYADWQAKRDSDLDGGDGQRERKRYRTSK